MNTLRRPIRSAIHPQKKAPGIDPTPGCVGLPPAIGSEGHFCAQRAAESLHQRVVFFQTAVTDPVPTIIDPFSE